MEEVKSKNSKLKISIQNLKFYVLSFSFAFCVFIFTFTCYAKEITILYTGETHAMLYPCQCPNEPDGGVARRAAKIKELRKDNPYCLVLDSGAFFAGGYMDEYSQNAILDRERTLVNLKAIKSMRYDALCIGDDEFNFGKEFLEEQITDMALPALSCNIKVKGALPYIIKDIDDINIGIIGITTPIAKQRTGNLELVEPRVALKETISAVKQKGAGLIVCLSHLGEEQDLNLIKEFTDIDILIIGHTRLKDEPFAKIGSTIILRPSWQGRHLDKINLKIENNEIQDFKVESIRLSEEIRDDAEVLSILPRCFSDKDCKKKDSAGLCQNPGKLNADCMYPKANPVSLLIVEPKDCMTCKSANVINLLKDVFPGIKVSYIKYPGTKAKRLLENANIDALPAYFLGKETEREKLFDSFKDKLEKYGDYYRVKSDVTGISYFIKRKRIKGKLDLFVSLFDKDIVQLLDVLRELNPDLHFLAISTGEGFDAANGTREVEEYLRAVCVRKYCLENFWDYLICRTKNLNSAWWEDCLIYPDTSRIKVCAKTTEGIELLKENISLNSELKIMFGPTYLLDNKEIFSTISTPSREELKKTLGKSRRR